MIRLTLAIALAAGWACSPTASRAQSLPLGPFRGGHAPSRAVPVPPAQEIEILDPGADPVGNPAVELTPSANGRTLVDVPRTVLVHKYYYTGDRSFQYKLMPGGPSTIVVDHPRTGQRMYLEASLPPGAPRVYYDAGSIEYDYGAQGVKIIFGSGKHGPPKVVYRQGTRRDGLFSDLTVGRSTRMKEVGARRRDEANAVNRVEGAVEPEVGPFGRVRRVLAGARRGAREAGRAASDAATQAVRSTPAGRLLGEEHQAAGAERRAEAARETERATMDLQPSVSRDL